MLFFILILCLIAVVTGIVYNPLLFLLLLLAIVLAYRSYYRWP